MAGQGEVPMSLAVAVLKEQAEGERRVALDPLSANKLVNKGFQVLIEKGAGEKAGFLDDQYSDCIILDDPEIILTMADIWLWVQVPVTEQLANLPEGRLGIGLVYAYRNEAIVDTLKKHKLSCMAVELLPRLNRTRSMDALSSQATVVGYTGTLRAASLAPRLFPMMTTAAGSIKPARVLIIGTEEIALQSIATARRLGAHVEVYDPDSKAREQVESLGAKVTGSRIDTVIDTSVSSDEATEVAEGETGTPQVATEEEKEQQETEELSKCLASADVVITTIETPNGPAPKVITETMVEGMKHGSVIVDLATQSGGNCVLTEAGKTVVHNKVLIDGPLDLASAAATHASEMYAQNLCKMLELVVENEKVKIDREDEVVGGALLTYRGELVLNSRGGSPAHSTKGD
jgi:NAD(P) transhydrogenase subunit alpha